jgi:hypothetical protein
MGSYLIIDAIASRGKPPVVAPNTGVGTGALLNIIIIIIDLKPLILG